MQRIHMILVLLFFACHRTPKKQLLSQFGEVESLQGHPMLVHEGKRIDVQKGTPTFAGDRLETDLTSKLRMVIRDGSVLAIGPGTSAILAQLELTERRQARLQINFGKFWLQVVKWKNKRSNFEVSTPTAVAGVRGTVLWGDTQRDIICALDGTIEVQNRSQPVSARLDKGHCVGELSAGKLTSVTPTAEQIKTYLNEVLVVP